MEKALANQEESIKITGKTTNNEGEFNPIITGKIEMEKKTGKSWKRGAREEQGHKKSDSGMEKNGGFGKHSREDMEDDKNNKKQQKEYFETTVGISAKAVEQPRWTP